MKKFREKIQYNGEEAVIVIEYSTSKSLGIPSAPQEFNLVCIYPPDDTIQFLATDKQVDLIRDRIEAAKKENGIPVCDDSLIQFPES